MLISAILCRNKLAIGLIVWFYDWKGSNIKDENGRERVEVREKSMEAFNTHLRFYMGLAGIESERALLERIRAVKKRHDDVTPSLISLRAALRGWNEPHPAFFRWLGEALEIRGTMEELYLFYTHTLGRGDYPKDPRSPPPAASEVA